MQMETQTTTEYAHHVASATERVREVLYGLALGPDNRMTADDLAAASGIEAQRQNVPLRDIIRELRRLKVPICSRSGRGGGYWIATSPCQIADTVASMRGRIDEELATIAALEQTQLEWDDDMPFSVN